MLRPLYSNYYTRIKKMNNTKYGQYGGQFVPEILMEEINKISDAYEHYKNNEKFNSELNSLLKEYAGRPSLLYFAKNL